MDGKHGPHNERIRLSCRTTLPYFQSKLEKKRKKEKKSDFEDGGRMPFTNKRENADPRASATDEM